MNHKEKKAYLSLRAEDLMKELNLEEDNYNQGKLKEAPTSLWRPEYGRFMIESTPFYPYTSDIKSMLYVEENMRLRRKRVEELAKDGEVLLTISMFPLFGAVKNFTIPESKPEGEIAKSFYASDDLINHHPRFGTLTRNIRERKGKKVCILSPLYMDKNTDPSVGLKTPFSKKELTKDDIPCCSPTHIKIETEEKKAFIHSDAMSFGMGCCCVQCTMSTKDIDEARNLYDQLVPVCPIFLSLTASTPIVRGLLANTDVRWYIISGSVDDRTKEEMKEISKSRYDSVSVYLGKSEEAKKNSDLKIKTNEQAYKKLIDSGIDESLAKHISHLFIRDPLVVFDYTKEIDDEKETDHFESIQSTNWQTCRFKPPPPNSDIGWRVEFRVMETQFTDFENAAFVVFIILLTRAILAYDLNFYMPLSKVDENMSRAHMRESVNKDKFYWRKNIKNDGKEGEIVELSIDEIINGGKNFDGFIPYVRKYVDSLNLEKEPKSKIDEYISFVSNKASGKLKTTATFIRDFVMKHEKYNHDSVINEEISYDLLKYISEISSGKTHPKDLF